MICVWNSDIECILEAIVYVLYLNNSSWKLTSGRTMVINVEYNQLDPLLRATGNPDGDVNGETGYSPFPGNINQVIFWLTLEHLPPPTNHFFFFQINESLLCSAFSGSFTYWFGSFILLISFPLPNLVVVGNTPSSFLREKFIMRLWKWVSSKLKFLSYFGDSTFSSVSYSFLKPSPH